MNNKEKIQKEIDIVKSGFNVMAKENNTNKLTVENFDSLFNNLDLNDARRIDESRDDYRLRRKRNKKILQLYMKHGRDIFKQAFPNGITETSIEQLIADREKAMNKDEKNG
jgi:hypothetical protein